jgi:hypothetical protein
MTIFSFHLVGTNPRLALGVFLRPSLLRSVGGLRHAECMAAMTLGSPILSMARLQLHHLAVFARWEDERALDSFLCETEMGRVFAEGWHVRLQFLRRWGRYPEFGEMPEPEENDPSLPVVAVTIARLKLPELFRFVHWGKPVEELVRDHPETTLALAALRPPRTFSTFSIWRSQQAMTDMVHGRGSGPGVARHAAAMAERNRKDFHHQFATFRFRSLSEHGEWLGRGDYTSCSEDSLD